MPLKGIRNQDMDIYINNIITAFKDVFLHIFCLFKYNNKYCNNRKNVIKFLDG